MGVLLAQYTIFALAALVVVLWFALPRGERALRRHLVYGGLAASLALGVNYALATLWYRPRPFVLYPHLVHLLVQHVPDASFPSDHVAVAAAFAAAIPKTHRWLRLLFWCLTALIALARVFVGVHWPVDVLGGAAVGALSLAMVLALRRPLARPVEWLVRTVRLPGRVSSGT